MAFPMVIGWALRIDGCRYILTTADVDSIVNWGGDDVPEDTEIARGVLERPTGTLTERVRPVDGGLDVTQLSFVLHDLPLGTARYGITDLFTRSLVDTSATYLLASLSVAAATMDVASVSALGSLPVHTWVGAEVIRVNSLAGGNTVNVTRGRYGTRAQAHTVDSDRGSNPEVFIRMPWATRRRVTLYRVEDGVARPFWTGHADHAPRRAPAPHAASWLLSCTHCWVRERAAKLGAPEPIGHLEGYDSRCIVLTVQTDGDANIWGASEPDRKSYLYRNFEDALKHRCDRLQVALVAAGGTNVSARATHSPTGFTVHVTCSSLGDFKFTVRIRGGGEEASASTDSRTVGAARLAVLTLPYRPKGALALVAHDLNASDVPTVNRYTAFRRNTRCPTDWTATSGYGVTITPVVAVPLGDDQLVELVPASASPITASDGTRYEPPTASFASRGGNPVISSSDPLAEPPPPENLHRSGVPVDRALPLRAAWRIDAPHWALALRWAIETASLGGMPDKRSWDFTTIDRLAGDIDTWSEVLWRIDGTQELGDFASSAARLFGCAVGVRAGKLALVAVRQITATETVAATITAANLRHGELPSWEVLEDGLVTHATLQSPSAEITVNDVVAQERFGQGRAIELRATGFRAATGVAQDPLAFARQVAHRVLRLWSDPVALVRVPLTADFRNVYHGDAVELSVFSAPKGDGTLGLVSARGPVIGRVYNFDTGGVDLEVVLLPPASGYAPCARVGAISGGSTVLELAASYAAGAGDYAGSDLASYEGVTADRGASRFAAGYKVRLIERDNESPLTESATVASVNTAARTITLTGALAGGWAAILAASGIVDVELDVYGTAGTAERKFAYVGDDADRQIVDIAPAKHWAV